MLWKAWACNLTMHCKSQFECFGISADDPQFMSHLFQLFQMFASCCNSSGVPWCAIIKHCQIVCGKSHKNGKNNQIKCSKRSQLVQLLCLFPICFQSLLFYYIQNCISLSGYFSRKDATFIWFFFFFHSKFNWPELCRSRRKYRFHIQSHICSNHAHVSPMHRWSRGINKHWKDDDCHFLEVNK